MNELNQGKIAGGDLFDMANSPIPELVEDLADEATLGDGGGAVPPRAVQVAGLILAESVRLIRLGTRREIAEASDALSQLLIEEVGEELEQRHPEAHRLVSGASVTLSAATPASSRGGAQTVLQSWSGKPLEVVERLYEAPGERLLRAELRAKVGILDQSHFSHMLSDMEGARLVVRVKIGKERLIRLGPAARSKEVRRMLVEPGPIFKREGSSQHLASPKRNLPARPEPTLARFESVMPPLYENESFTGAPTQTTLTICRLSSLRSLNPSEEENSLAEVLELPGRLLPQAASN